MIHREPSSPTVDEEIGISLIQKTTRDMRLLEWDVVLYSAGPLLYFYFELFNFSGVLIFGADV